MKKEKNIPKLENENTITVNNWEGHIILMTKGHYDTV